jgi:hypothetical protein
MKKTPLLFLVLLIGTGLNAFAQVDFDFSFSQLKGNGVIPFANSLYQDPGNASQLVSRLSPLVQGAGEFNSYEVVSRRYLTKKIERVIVVLYFERLPIYMRIDYYDTSKGRICLPASVSKEASDILPFELISASGK